MKRPNFAAALLFAVSSYAFAQFEGVAEFKGISTTSEGRKMPSTGKIYVSKNACRVEWEMDLRQLAAERQEAKGMVPERIHQTTIQRLSDPDHLYVVNDERRTFSVIDLSKAHEETKGISQAKYTVKKLGRDTVAGLSCDKALVTSSSGTDTEVCVSRELVPSSGWLSAMNQRQGYGGLIGALKDNGLDGFPIRWVFREKGEKQASSTIELTRFAKKSLPGSLFEIPAGYRRTSASSVMMTPEQEKAMKEARRKALQSMTPEQRKKYEEYLKEHQKDQ